jgi:ATP-dependent RNA helicase RhlE
MRMSACRAESPLRIAWGVKDLPEIAAAAPAAVTFADLNLAPMLMKALATENYTTPTPIQAQAIPAIMQGSDLLGIAQTGTGKTAAFALPILHRLAASPRRADPKGCRVLVLSPTRELATQIAASFKAYGRHMGVSVATVFGGVGYRPQTLALQRGVDVLVATPGRLIDHLQQRTADLRTVEIFVLDEADQMLDLGFLKPIRTVVSGLPKERQNLFFSATMPDAIGSLAGDLLRDPVKVSVTPVSKTADRVVQRMIHVTAGGKRDVLTDLLSDPAFQRTIVFTRTKHGADKVTAHLVKAGIESAAIHGNKSQAQRERTLNGFRRGATRVLVATDIAARGIDISSVSHVINYELPETPEAYVHRIGRTARAGAEGIAISLCSPEERGSLRDIERLIKQHIPAETRGDVTLPSINDVTSSRGRQQQQSRRGQNNRPQFGDKLEYRDRPQGDRPQGDRPQGDRPQGDRPPQRERSNGERGYAARATERVPHAERAPYAERAAQAARPTYGERPQGQRTAADGPSAVKDPRASDTRSNDFRGGDFRNTGGSEHRGGASRGGPRRDGQGFNNRNSGGNAGRPNAGGQSSGNRGPANAEQGQNRNRFRK